MRNFRDQLKKLGKTQVWVRGLTGESAQLVSAWFTGRSKVPERHREILEKNGFIWEQEVSTDDRLEELGNEVAELRADIAALGEVLRMGFRRLGLDEHSQSHPPGERT